MSRVLVTGGTGVVGTAVVPRLVSQDREVRALVRSDVGAARMRSWGVEPAPGDVLDPDSLSAAVRGVDVVYHIAGLNSLCPQDPAALFEVNVAGTRNVVEAAARSRVGRLVLTSSGAAIGERKGSLGSETSEHRGSFLSRYERSKHLAERLAFDLGARCGLDVVAVNPCSVQGPGRSTGTARILSAYIEGKLKLFLDTRLSIVDIDDCAEGHLLAEHKGVPGERYLLCGATLSSREALQLAGRVAGVSHEPRMVPASAAYAAAAWVEGAARMKGKDPSVCRAMVRTIAFGHAYDGSRASRELGLVYTPIEATLERTIKWLREQGAG
ncbi:MAG: SDR family NAD(P)-dependent oxidoreductase [Actinomycetota bacterium]|nr:SDR family NAD(P)-dependent oxidoreductase [Actinomycetota bacterium]